MKVMATIASGFSTVERRARKRWVRSSVLPEPAGAWTRKDSEMSRARSRVAASGGGMGDFRVACVGGGEMLTGAQSGCRINFS